MYTLNDNDHSHERNPEKFFKQDSSPQNKEEWKYDVTIYKCIDHMLFHFSNTYHSWLSAHLCDSISTVHD